MRYLAIATPGLIAIAVFWSTLSGGLLSDDLLLSALWNQAGDGVNWGHVFADFGRAWFGLDAPLYRPLLTLSFAIDIAVFGDSVAGYHATNLLLHAIAVCATATVAWVLGQKHGHGARAALVCGSIAALHPVVVESVAWIAARNSGIEVAFRSIALALFALHLARPRLALLGGSLLATVAALGCKESAVVVIVCAFAIDVLYEPGRAFSARAKLLAPFAALLVGYFALRVALFGTPLGSPGTSASDAGPVGIAATKLAAVLLPRSGAFDIGTFGIAAFSALFVIVLVGLALRRSSLVAVTALALLPLLMAPTHTLELHAEFSGSRMLLGAVHAFAVLIAGTAFAHRRLGWLTTLAGGAVALAMFAPTDARIARFERAWSEVRAATDGIGEACEARAADTPLALLAMPQVPSVPPMNQNAWFPLAQRPLQAADYPLISLGYVNVPVPGSNELYHDPSAAHALWNAGATISLWNDPAKAFQTWRPGPGTIDLELRRLDDSGSFQFTQPIDALACELLEVRVSGDASSGRVHLRVPTELPPNLAIPLGPGRRDGKDTVFFAELSHSMTPIALRTNGLHISGLRIEIDGSNPAPNLRVLPRPRVGVLDPPTRIEGAESTLGELLERVAQPANGTDELRLILLCPHSAVALPIDRATGAVRLDDTKREILELIISWSRSDEYWFFLETAPGSASPRRSDLDHCRLRSG